MEKRAYNLKETAQMLGICQQTVRRLIQEGKLRANRPSERRIIVPESAICEYLDSGRVNDRS